MTGWFSPLLFYLARCTENELRRQIEPFKAENEMLRDRVPKKRIFLKRDERERLLKLGAAIGPGASKLITIVHRRTYQRWVREKTSGKKPKKMGRPHTLESVREIIIRLARETGLGIRPHFRRTEKIAGSLGFAIHGADFVGSHRKSAKNALLQIMSRFREDYRSKDGLG